VDEQNVPDYYAIPRKQKEFSFSRHHIQNIIRKSTHETTKFSLVISFANWARELITGLLGMVKKIPFATLHPSNSIKTVQVRTILLDD
jgi:hypothetical protein